MIFYESARKKLNNKTPVDVVLDAPYIKIPKVDKAIVKKDGIPVDYELDWSTPQICLFVGKPNRGKTHAMKHLVMERCLAPDGFKFGVVFTGTTFDDEYDWVPNNAVIQGYDRVAFFRYLSFLEEMSPNIPSNFIIFDDLVGILDKQDPYLLNFICNHRHYNCTVFLSIQYIFQGATPTLRECVTKAFLFNTKTKKTLNALFECYGQFFERYKDFKTFFMEKTSKKFECILFVQDNDDIRENYFEYKAPAELPLVKLIW